MANEKIQTSNSLTNLQNNFNESIAAKDREILNLKGSHDDILEQIAKKVLIIITILVTILIMILIIIILNRIKLLNSYRLTLPIIVTKLLLL